MVATTQEDFVINEKLFTRIYFHTPINYSDVLDQYAADMVSFSELLELRESNRMEDAPRLFSWNLCPDVFTNVSKESCVVNSHNLTFITGNEFDYFVYLGLKPTDSEERVCLIGPQNSLYIDAKCDWKTFGFGIILSEDKMVAKPLSSIKVSAVDVVRG